MGTIFVIFTNICKFTFYYKLNSYFHYRQKTVYKFCYAKILNALFKIQGNQLYFTSILKSFI